MVQEVANSKGSGIKITATPVKSAPKITQEDVDRWNQSENNMASKTQTLAKENRDAIEKLKALLRETNSKLSDFASINDFKKM